MSQICNKCSRINPDEASFCYFDGSALVGHLANGAPVKTGARPFPHQFVYPSGRVCGNFDQLAVAFQENWAETRDLLQQGYLETFLGGLGRTDLAVAAREASLNPDRDRGLDQLLDKLPTDVLRGPKLAVEPTEINLGQLTNRSNRHFELRLFNQGMRLLFGSVTCENGVWLALGESPGAPQKVFQFESELTIPVQIRGKLLQASTKPQEGRLSIESNGGRWTVLVRAEVPPVPFLDGVLAGAVSPRHLAEKAKAHPKEAATFFETGAVAKWYKDNGWTYPVRGPIATGVGAVQQFFEALGLTPTPKVEVSATTIILRGRIGQPVDYSLQITTQEKRPVYASASSDQPWLIIGRTKLDGRKATIPLTVPSIPDSEESTLKAKLTVTANGNQRFVVPVSLELESSFEFGGAFSRAEEEIGDPADLSEFQFDAGDNETESESVEAEKHTSSTPPPRASAKASSKARPKIRLRLPQLSLRQLIWAIPAAGLGFALLWSLLWDLWSEPAPSQRIHAKGKMDDHRLMSDPLIVVNFKESTRRFGFQVLPESDRNDQENRKKLTFDPYGATNNTCIRIGNDDSLFGQLPGKWASEKGRRLDLVEEIKGRRWKSVMDFPEEIRVTQTIAILPNEETLKFDTCLIHYLVENRSGDAKNIGVRFMLDASIGDNHGVSFRIPGTPGLVDSMRDFHKGEIPNSVQALEQSDSQDPGTVAQLGLRLPDFRLNEGDPELDPWERLVICRWKDRDVRWDWDFKPINEDPERKSSCVVLYWPEEALPAGGKRAMAFTYGLGSPTSTLPEGMELTLDHRSIRPGQVFTVTAHVNNSQPDQMIHLHLPEDGGFSLVDGQERGQAGGEKGQASWKVRAGEAGRYILVATSGLARVDQDIEIKRPSAFR